MPKLTRETFKTDMLRLADLVETGEVEVGTNYDSFCPITRLAVMKKCITETEVIERREGFIGKIISCITSRYNLNGDGDHWTWVNIYDHAVGSRAPRRDMLEATNVQKAEAIREATAQWQ